MIITKTYNNGLYDYNLYYYGRIAKGNHSLAELPGPSQFEREFGYHNCGVEIRSAQEGGKTYYALISYETDVGYFVINSRSKSIKYYDFSKGYSCSTSRQAGAFKTWLSGNKEGYSFKKKEFKSSASALRRLARGAF